ncbi:MAG TPA: Ldh family oxidoreductase [Candidatus Methylomirabilis sp.]|nr:Ldh family oxidoreductase [Candidatus Methylomirabilis sp.]HSC72005.1 Ldh family oxidoreductase [Candidatus Methylomirabilis sp.]
MPGVDAGILFPAARLREWTQEVFRRVGVGREDAALLADSLIEANLRGVDTHGITRMLCVYVQRIQKGVLSPRTELVVVRENASTALIDCKNSLGQVGAARAMAMAIEKAAKTGVAFVAVTHSNHYGAAAYFAMKALEHGMIGMSATNAPAAVAPTGGRTPMLGTNPFAIAIPAGDERPVVLDLATTVVARGRILLYAKQNKPLEPGWAFDERGRPTVDPPAALKGLLAPIGGYKGYGISLAVDLLCGVLTGSNYGAHFPGFLADNMRQPTDLGSVFAALNVESFMDLPEFRAGMDKAIREVKTSERAEGVERIYIPGEIEFETKAERLAQGIPIPEPVVKDFLALGKELGVPFPAA